MNININSWYWDVTPHVRHTIRPQRAAGIRLCVRQGFSLIELIIVLSVITILLLVVVTVVPMVREASRQTVCAGNLRQILVSQLSYSQDWNGRLQPMFTTQDAAYYPAQYWSTMMNFLTNDHGLNRSSFFCPSVAKHDRTDYLFGASTWDYYGTHTDTDYAYVANPILGPGKSNWSNFSTVPRRTADRPADTVVIADLVLTADTNYLPYGNYRSNHLGTRQLSGAWQTARTLLRGANQGSLDGHVSFKPGSAFPSILDARTGPSFNATLTHCWDYNWGFFF